MEGLWEIESLRFQLSFSGLKTYITMLTIFQHKSIKLLMKFENKKFIYFLLSNGEKTLFHCCERISQI